MRTFIIQYYLNKNFWDQYDQLWQNSIDRSPFQAPAVLKYLSLVEKDVRGCLFFKNQELHGAVLLKKENKWFNFLSDRKSDANWFLFHKNCTDEEIEYFLTAFFIQVNELNWSLLLNIVKSWNNNIELFDKAGKKSALFWKNPQYAVCPALEADNPELLFSTINRSRHIRYAFKPIIKQFSGEFEICTDETILGTWVNDFCFDPEYAKLSSGKSLIYIMTQWFKENNYTVFDFGIGDEEYKYSLANKDQYLQRIFNSPKNKNPFYNYGESN